MDKQIKGWLALVKQYYGLCDGFDNQSKERGQCRARAVAMCLLSHRLDLTQEVIGKIFNKKRTTVCHAIMRAMECYKKDIEDIEDMEKKTRQEEMTL